MDDPPIIHALENELHELESTLADPATLRDAKAYRTATKRHAEVQEILGIVRERDAAQRTLEDANDVLAEASDDDLRTLAQEERDTAERRLQELNAAVEEALHPADPLDAKNIIVEIRAGAGGDEAGLFAADLYRMYTQYAEQNGFSTSVVNASRSGIGGFKEIIFEVVGRGAYSKLKYESGVHRVQRIPETEKSGRVHTSTTTVAVLPEAEETDMVLKPEDLRIDVFRSSGHGGQSVNTTDSAVRITHVPTNTVVTCQDEKSQHKNREKAMKVLRARLLAEEASKQQAERSAERRSQIGTGDRSEKIRTYNVPQDRVTDHRIQKNFSHLQGVLDGNLEPLISALKNAERDARA